MRKVISSESWIFLARILCRLVSKEGSVCVVGVTEEEGSVTTVWLRADCSDSGPDESGGRERVLLRQQRRKCQFIHFIHSPLVATESESEGSPTSPARSPAPAHAQEARVSTSSTVSSSSNVSV